MAEFHIDVPEPVLTDLRERLARTIWPEEVDGIGWDRGTDAGYLKELVEHWRTAYDWRATEAELNTLSHVKVDVDGVKLHAVVQAGDRPDATPLLLLHGWPDSFLRYLKVLPLLTDFTVVVPSLPGYGFSGRARPGQWTEIGDVAAGLMTALGHDRFVVSGGDIGANVAESLAERHPDRLLGLHLTDVPYWRLMTVDPATMTPAEQQFFGVGMHWVQTEGAYMMVQSTKPMTAAYGLTDSPAGLAGWMVEKLRSWSDCGGDLDRRFTRDEVLSFVTLYWVTRTIGSTFDTYVERNAGQNGPAGRVEVPTGVTNFPHDVVKAPREYADRFFDVRHWSELPRGGHFTAWEEPELFAEDLRAFVAKL